MSVGDAVVFLNGSYGVGRSATLNRYGDLLREGRIPFSLMDVDWFHRSWPPAANDPDNMLVEAANLAAAWANYRAVGSRQLIVSGVVAGPADRDRYEEAFNLPVRSARLTARRDVAEARLRRRYSPDQGSALNWHLERHAELDLQLIAADLDEVVMATDEISPRQVARQVLTSFGVLPPASSGSA